MTDRALLKELRDAVLGKWAVLTNSTDSVDMYNCAFCGAAAVLVRQQKVDRSRLEAIDHTNSCVVPMAERSQRVETEALRIPELSEGRPELDEVLLDTMQQCWLEASTGPYAIETEDEAGPPYYLLGPLPSGPDRPSGTMPIASFDSALPGNARSHDGLPADQDHANALFLAGSYAFVPEAVREIRRLRSLLWRRNVDWRDGRPLRDRE